MSRLWRKCFRRVVSLNTNCEANRRLDILGFTGARTAQEIAKTCLLWAAEPKELTPLSGTECGKEMKDVRDEYSGLIVRFFDLQLD